MKTENDLLETLTLEITDLAFGGEGVGRHEGYVIFVPFALPGETVSVRLVEKKKDYAKGKLEAVLSASPQRVEPKCPYFYRCGGCQLQHLDYSGQIEAKTRFLDSALYGLHKLQDFPRFPILSAQETWYYRNKTQMVICGKEAPYLAYYQKNSHLPERIDKCLIQSRLNNRAIKETAKLLPALNWPVYQEKHRHGKLRYLLSRSNQKGDELQVTLVSSHPKLPGMVEFITRMRENLPKLSGLFLNINPHPGNVILGKETHLLWGKTTLEEELGGIKFQLSPGSFFQVNHPQSSRIVEWVKERCAAAGAKRVLDLFCGVGLFALHLSSLAEFVLGIEEAPSSIRDARQSGKQNLINNVDFLEGKAERELEKLSYDCDLCVLDPPRKGCEETLLENLAQRRIPKILYVSCHPATLARDLLFLGQKGYRIDSLGGVDMFPHTTHLECLAELSLAE